jgi:hypothetical protein
VTSALECRPQQLAEELLGRGPSHPHGAGSRPPVAVQTGPPVEHRRVGVAGCVAEAAPRRPDPNCVSSVSLRPPLLANSGAHDKHDEYHEGERVHDVGRGALDVESVGERFNLSCRPQA